MPHYMRERLGRCLVQLRARNNILLFSLLVRALLYDSDIYFLPKIPVYVEPAIWVDVVYMENLASRSVAMTLGLS